MMNKLKPTITLLSICLIVALLLSAVNLVTEPIITARAEAAANEALREVLPSGTSFTKLELTDNLPSAVTDVWQAPEGYVFKTSTKGYADGMIIMCGVDMSGAVTGSKCLSSNETYGFENKLDGAYDGEMLDNLELIIAAGASKNSATSNGYHDGIEAALQAFAILGGADVDLRSDEEILQDNLNAALGTEGVVFTKWFATEVLTGVDAIYESDLGCVAVIGESYVGISAEGTATGEVSAENKAAAEAAYLLYKGSTLTAVEIPEGAHNNVLEIYVTESGNYVFVTQGAGFGINGDKYYNPSGEYIKVKLCISGEGEIISTLTLYENETDGRGDYASDPEWYEQFNGATSETYGDIENVANASLTSKGYKYAIKYAFEAFALLNNAEEGE